MNNLDKKIKEYLLKGKTYRQIKRELHTSSRRIKKVKNTLMNDLQQPEEYLGINDENLSGYSKQELIEILLKLKRKLQKYMDNTRIDRKDFRKYARIYNLQETIEKEFISLLKEYSSNLKNEIIQHEEINNKSVGIVHLTDLHFNELVNLPSNKVTFEVLSKRLKLFVEKSKHYFKSYGISNVLIAITGDIINSDRRLDEIMNNATNRTKATLLAIDLLKQVIIDFNKDFNVSVAGVVGNESRIPQEIGWGNGIASDNYDYMIYEILKRMFEGTKVKFYLNNNDPFEQVITILGQNVLLIHGHQKIFGQNYEKTIQMIKGKYVAQGISVNFVLTGHLHSCRIGDTYARGSSLIGANGYSDKGLMLESRASQNIHILFDNGTRDSIKIDLQDTGDIKGYNITKELEAYNIKSWNKLKQKTVIFEVLI